MLANPGALQYGVLFGNGVIDYRENVLADEAGNALDKVQYRGNGSCVVVLGTRGVQLIVFDFEGPNRIKPAGFDCALVRAGPPTMTNAADPSAQSTSSAAPARSAAAGGGIAGLSVKFGFTIAAVRQTLTGQRVSLMRGFTNSNINFNADGDFSDIDRRIKLVSYEFDQPEGPEAKLIGVVLTCDAREIGGTRSVVFGVRTATVSRQYPQSPTQMQANLQVATIRLIDDPNTGNMFEIYRVQ